MSPDITGRGTEVYFIPIYVQTALLAMKISRQVAMKISIYNGWLTISKLYW